MGADVVEHPAPADRLRQYSRRKGRLLPHLQPGNVGKATQAPAEITRGASGDQSAQQTQIDARGNAGAASGYVCPVDNAAKPFVVGVVVPAR